ncbi:MAG: hypothetical protein RLO01_18450 [Thalassobaculaceae bacterium]
MTRFRTPAAPAAALLLALSLAGCVDGPLGGGFAETGRQATPVSGITQDRDGGEGRINSFAQFDDIPIPVDAEMDLGQTLVLGDREGWIGRLSLDVTHSMTDMYAFYEQEMPRFGWERITTVRARISTLTYERGPRVATITLQPTLTDGTVVDFTVAPGRTPGRAPGS